MASQVGITVRLRPILNVSVRQPESETSKTIERRTTYECCACCQSWQSQPVPALMEAAKSDRTEHFAECVMKSYGIRPLSERLALPLKPTLVETFLASASIFVDEEGEADEKVNGILPDWARDDHAEMVTKWEVQRLLWERLWYCADCDSVFDLQTRQFEASKDITILIRT